MLSIGLIFCEAKTLLPRAMSNDREVEGQTEFEQGWRRHLSQNGYGDFVYLALFVDLGLPGASDITSDAHDARHPPHKSAAPACSRHASGVPAACWGRGSVEDQ